MILDKLVLVLEKLFPKYMDEKIFSCMLSAAKEEILAIVQNRLDKFERELLAKQEKNDENDDVRDRVYPANVNDVAAYIDELLRPISVVKMHQLLYYCQVWSLVWDGQQLFTSQIVAGPNNPEATSLITRQQTPGCSYFGVGNPNYLHKEQKKTIEAVVDYYGSKTSQWLMELIHREGPWNKPAEGGVITHESLYKFYKALYVVGPDK